LEKTSPIFSYFTFAKGGYIIKIKPIANGILVVPLENELIHWRIQDKNVRFQHQLPSPKISKESDIYLKN
jgi:hypothetical protein